MFRVGEIVRLKSGGPQMTVRGEELDQNVTCDWFTGDEAKQATFQRDQLEKVDQ